MEPKNPAAVALGKLRAQTFTQDEIDQFQKVGMEAARAAWKDRTWEERLEIKRKRRIARRVNPPAWMRRAQERIARDQTQPPPQSPPPAPAPAVDPAEIARMQDALYGLSDQEIEQIANAIAGKNNT